MRSGIILSVAVVAVWAAIAHAQSLTQRPIEVVNVLADEVELRFLDMPDASDLERVFSTKHEQMLSRPNHSQGPAYRLVRDA